MNRPAHLEAMTQVERDQWIVDGYASAFAPELRLAQAALLAWASEAPDTDGWPMPADVIRFANCYGVTPAALGGLVGLLPHKVGRRTVWADMVRTPSVGHTVGIETFPREALRGYGMFRAASALIEREAATLH